METRPNQALVFRRRLDNEQKVLRFRARLLSEQEVDVDYIISVFAVDNTVQVRAVDTPNSGLGMKVFLSRQSIPKPKADGQSSVTPMTALGTVSLSLFSLFFFALSLTLSLCVCACVDVPPIFCPLWCTVPTLRPPFPLRPT